ncbi:hypothetical protein ACHAXR_010425 [Thalassiosira sp. AJA248-18]
MLSRNLELQWANTLFEGIHEIDFLPRWQTYLVLYFRFIDDAWALWIPSGETTTDEANWLALQADTTVYEKPTIALYLFVPPHSDHPPGVLPGHIFGNILRIFRLNSDEEDFTQDTIEFFNRFTCSGHDFHPRNPTSTQIQQLFHETVLHPPGKKQLNEKDAGYCFKVPIGAMIIAYHRAPNLGDKFSYRNISNRNCLLSLHTCEKGGIFFKYWDTSCAGINQHLKKRSSKLTFVLKQ